MLILVLKIQFPIYVYVEILYYGLTKGLPNGVK